MINISRLTIAVPTAVIVASLGVSLAFAQAPASPAVAVPPAPQTPGTTKEKALGQLRVQVTLTRYDGSKKTASLPFMLWVTTDGDVTSMNAGQSVPVPSPHFGAANAPTTFTMQSVGTAITCRATPSGDGQFRLNLTVRDSYLTPAATTGGMVTLKSLETNNSLLLRDGQTADFVAATDKISGEVTRIDVTATVLK